MTGRDIVIYILKNNFEDKSIYEIISDSLMACDEAADKFNVGISTVKTWAQLGMIPCFKIGGSIYILKTAKKPNNNYDIKESKNE